MAVSSDGMTWFLMLILGSFFNEKFLNDVKIWITVDQRKLYSKAFSFTLKNEILEGSKQHSRVPRRGNWVEKLTLNAAIKKKARKVLATSQKMYLKELGIMSRTICQETQGFCNEIYYSYLIFFKFVLFSYLKISGTGYKITTSRDELDPSLHDRL